MNNSVIVIDVGSSKIIAVSGERGVNGTFAVDAFSELRYEGFSEGKFFDEGELKQTIINVLTAVCDSSRYKASEIFVGVPGSFIRIENRKFRLSFGRKKKITAKDKEDLLEAGKRKIEVAGYEAAHASGVYYSLDDNRKVADPVGCVSSSLGGLITYQLCENYFSELVRTAVAKVSKASVRFVYDGYAEGRFLLGDDAVDAVKVIVDVGYITTNSTIFVGDGVIAKDSLDCGGGYITAALVEKYGLSPGAAERLKREISLGYVRGGQSKYVVEDDGDVKSYPVEEINETVKGVLDEIAGNVDEFLEENSGKVNVGEIYLTGGGISYMRGAKEHLAGRFGQAVDVLVPAVPQYNKPVYASAISLLDFALAERKTNAFLRIFTRR
ncbi:MAG: hypothetical protein SPJ70_01820 [Candidatus Borkfalkiaceae bacterium]|nr:hypothetical protein [Christensenellaceae bacterium]